MHHRKVVRKALSLSLVLAVLISSLFGSMASASPSTSIGVEPGTAHEQPAVQNAAAAQFDTLTPSETNVAFALSEGSHPVTVEAKYKDGSAKDVTTQGVWMSMNPAVAVVNRGVITAKAAGTTEVRLNLGDAVVNVPVTITAGAGAPEAAEPLEPTLVTYLLSTLNVFVEADTNYPLHLHGTFTDGSTRDITADAVWSTDDAEVATVSHGMIKGIKGGASTFIRVKYGSMPTLSIAVTVQKDPIPFQLFGLLMSEDVLKIMETDVPHKIYADLEYPDQDRYEVTNLGKWYSKDESIATVDQNGVITPVGKGMTYIYFEYKYTAPSGTEGEDGYDDGLLVNAVQVFVGGPFKLERFTPDMMAQLELDTPVSLPPRSYQEITIMGVYSEDPRTGQNYNADDVTGDIEWTVADKSIATINDSGRIFAGGKEGTTTITGHYLALEPFTFNVTVTKAAAANKVLNLVAEPTYVEIKDGKPVQSPIIKAIYNDGTVEDVTSKIAGSDWLASDASVAYHSDNGTIVAESVGSAVLGAIYKDEIAIIPVIVKQAEPKTAVSLSVTPDSLNLQLGKHEALSVEAVMSGGEKLDKTQAAVYRSANPQVVSVNRKGEITAVGKGTAAIEVSYGGQQQSVTIEVAASEGLPPVTETPKQITGVTVSDPKITLDVTAGPRTVTVQAAYSDGTSADVTAQGKWSTQDAGVVTVKDGVLTPVAPGSTRVHLVLDGAVIAVRVTVKEGDFSSNVRVADEGAAAEPTVDALLLSTTKILVQKGAKYPVQLLAVKSDGTTEDVSDQAAWSVYDTEIADVVSENGAVSILGKSTGNEIPLPGYQKFGRTTLTVGYGDFTPTIVNVAVTEQPDQPDVLDIGFRTYERLWYFDDASFRLYKGQAPYELKPFALDTTGDTFPAEGQWTFSQPGIVDVNVDSGFEALGTGETDAVFTYERYGLTYKRTLHFEVVDLQGITADADEAAGVYSVDVHPQGSSLVALKETYVDKDGQSHTDPLSGFVNWQIDDPDLVAMYDEQPYVRFVAGTKEGTTRVTGDYFGHEIAFDVTVTKNPIKPKIMTLVADPTYYVFDDADDQPVAPVVKAIYSDATVQTLNNADLTWFSGDPTIADLTEDGKIMRTNRKGGTNVVGQYKGIPVRVPVISTYSDATPVATGLTITPDLTSMTVGGTQQLKATATMSDLSEPVVTDLAMFESKNPDVVTISEDGLVTAVKPGTAKLRVYYWGFNEYLTITVTQANTGGSGPIVTPPTPPVTDPVSDQAPVTPTPETPVLNASVDGAAVKDRIGKAKADPTSVTFSDVPSTSWSASAIELASKAGFVQGYADGSFLPKKNVTRAEFASMLAKALGLSESASVSFTDVKDNNWAHGAISALEALGFIKGYGDGSFKPNQQITRAEMVAILAKVIDFGKAAHNSTFTDLNNHWAAKAIDALTEAGVVKGRGENTFAPNANATREEAVVLILRALNASLDLGLTE
ncbi:S-layer homology domain-containing protein [Paenibacillus sp. R14(2021)]|uniref:S-layer homology domain-containing protein n=1 Tax=Paenibacillus sp. R14(2021) TaxID=2859228 RepID=UPI001C6150E9|nr:S-layer homology domain-containing protein [Paenibacillus sp. R14(2021)]